MITKKPEIFLILVVILLSLFLFSPKSHAIYTGDDTYTDNNNTIIIAYNTISNDLIFRLDSLTNDSQYVNLISFLKNVGYGYYLYYGDSDGRSMINGNTYNQSDLWVAVYDLSNPYMSIASGDYRNYQGMDCFINVNQGVMYCYRISEDGIDVFTGISVYMPSILYNYRSDNLTNYLKNGNSSVVSAIDDLTSSVDNTTSAVQETTSAVQSMENTIVSRDDNQAIQETNTIYSSLTTSTSSQDSNSNSIFNFISSFWSTITNSMGDDNIETLTINLPFVTGGITFRSDMLYNIIKNTLIYTLLQLAYYYVFGMYVVMGTWRILCWFQQGEFTKAKNLPIDIVMNHMLM